GAGVRALRGLCLGGNRHPPRLRSRRQGAGGSAPARSRAARADRARALEAQPGRPRRAEARSRLRPALTMNGHDPLAAWRGNPFLLLEISPQASRTEVERAGQRLIALLAVGSASAARYNSPLGPATRDADAVRQALAKLRDPDERAIAELWARVADATPG